MQYSKKRIRSGVAAVEAAVCLPILALVVFGAVEMSAGIFQEYNAQSVAFELSKVALASQTECDDVQDLAAEILPQLGFDTYNVAIDVIPRTVNQSSVESPTTTNFQIPSSGSTTNGLESVPRGTMLRMTLTINRPASVTNFFRSALGETISSECVFCKEF